MSTPERRKHPRVNVHYPVSYVCKDGKGCVMQENMGVALNISQSGIFIETAEGIFAKHITIISVDLNNSIIKTKGKVAFCKKSKSGKYGTGISFEGTHAQNINFVKRLIRAFYYNKEEYRNSAAATERNTCMHA